MYAKVESSWPTQIFFFSLLPVVPFIAGAIDDLEVCPCLLEQPTPSEWEPPTQAKGISVCVKGTAS